MAGDTHVARRTVPRVAVARAWLRERAWLLWGLPLLLAAVYGIAVLADFSSVITSINMDSDVAVAPVMAKLLGQAPTGSHVLLGNHPYYEEFLFLRATAGLPFYRQLWDVAPMLWSLLGLAVLAWSAWWALGGFAAMLTTAALICLGALGRFSFFTFDWHGLSVLHTIVIGAALVWLAPRTLTISKRATVLLAVALGVFTALPVASDKPFLFWAIVPMLLTALLIGWRSAGRTRWLVPMFAVITVVVALLGGALVSHVMRSEGITASPFKFTFVPIENLVNNLELLGTGYMSLGGGDFFGQHTHLDGYALLASGLLLLGALVMVLLETRRLAATSGPRGASAEPASPRFAYVCFWTASLLVQSAAFVFSSTPVDTLSSRYVLAGYVAIGALLPLLALRGPGWRLAVTAGVCVFALSGIYQLIRQPFNPGNTFPGPAEANGLVRFARAEGVTYGYSGYWDAADLTWLTKFKVKLYPVVECAGTLCPYPSVQINTWYVPRPHTRSLLVTDSSQPGVSTLPSALGPPLVQTQIGNMTAAVYPFDLSSRLAP